jgi:HAMP domain-containing protein
MKTRRFFVPTIFSIALVGLIAAHLYFNDSPWSVIRLLGKIASVCAAIIAPVFTPALYSWIDEIAVPMSMIGLALLLLLLSIARAKKAMSRVTPQLGVEAPLSLSNAYTDEKPLAPEMESRFSTPSHLRQRGLLGKLTVSFVTVGGLFGAAVCIIVYVYIARVIETEIKDRANITLLAITELAARQSASRSDRELSSEVAKYASANGVAYIYVEDADGKIVAHEPNELPIYLNRDFPRSAERALLGTDIDYRGVPVYEIAKRVGDGKRGFVHLGLLRGVIAGESRGALAPIMAAIVVLLVGMMGAFVYVARALNRPFLELVEQADRISKGEFMVPLELKRTDEIGEIARSLERMRSSLHAAVTRLEADQLNNSSN